MPDPIDNDLWDEVYQTHDNNYTYHPICKTCSSNYWKDSLQCFCGEKVHESQMIHLSDVHPILYDSSHIGVNTEKLEVLSKYYYSITHDGQHMTFVNDQPYYSALQLVLEKGCSRCVSTDGYLSAHGYEKVINFVDKSVKSFDEFLSQKLFAAWHYKQSFHMSTGPSDNKEQISLSIKSPGKIGYVRNYSTIF